MPGVKVHQERCDRERVRCGLDAGGGEGSAASESHQSHCFSAADSEAAAHFCLRRVSNRANPPESVSLSFNSDSTLDVDCSPVERR